MKVLNDTQSSFDPGGNKAPHLFYGDAAPGTDMRFLSAPIGSMYWDVTNYITYIKTANTASATDWKPMLALGVTTTGNVTVTGDMTVSGTVTAGDVVATNA